MLIRSIRRCCPSRIRQTVARIRIRQTWLPLRRPPRSTVTKTTAADQQSRVALTGPFDEAAMPPSLSLHSLRSVLIHRRGSRDHLPSLKGRRLTGPLNAATANSAAGHTGGMSHCSSATRHDQHNRFTGQNPENWHTLTIRWKTGEFTQSLRRESQPVKFSFPACSGSKLDEQRGFETRRTN